LQEQGDVTTTPKSTEETEMYPTKAGDKADELERRSKNRKRVKI
jgi:hypothetical protein